MAQTVKNLPVMQETQVLSLGQEDPLEKEMATHSSILAWRIPWTEEPGGLQSVGSQKVGQDWATNTQYVTHSPLFCWVLIFVLPLHKYVFLTSLLSGSAWPESRNSCLSGPPELSCPGSLEALEAGDSPGHSCSTSAPGKSPLTKWPPASNTLSTNRR